MILNVLCFSSLPSEKVTVMKFQRTICMFLSSFLSFFLFLMVYVYVHRLLVIYINKITLSSNNKGEVVINIDLQSIQLLHFTMFFI